MVRSQLKKQDFLKKHIKRCAFFAFSTASNALDAAPRLEKFRTFGKRWYVVFTLIQKLGFRIRFYLFKPSRISSSTQNAPGFALFRLFRVHFLVFHTFGRAKFSSLLLCTLPHSIYRLKSLGMLYGQEVSLFVSTSHKKSCKNISATKLRGKSSSILFRHPAI